MGNSQRRNDTYIIVCGRLVVENSTGDLGVDKDKGKYIPVTYHEDTERVRVIGPLTFNSDTRWGG
jgi:hypothetical protein